MLTSCLLCESYAIIVCRCVVSALLCSPVRAAGTLLGEGIANFVTDWDKVSATVSG